jgi:hypothetical protein
MAPSNAATLRGMKAALTSKINTATTQFDTINAIARPALPTSKALEGLQAAHDKVREQQERISGLLLNLIGEEEDEAAANAWQAELTAADTRANEICDAVTALLAAATVPPRPAAAQPAPGAAGRRGGERCKPNDALRPDKLTSDHSPADYTIWKENFHDYYTSSNMDVATASEQRSYLFSCVNLALQKRLRGLVQRNTPIYDTATERGCMSFIDDEFMDIHPVVARRLAFFNETQSTKQSFTEFVATVRSQADEADLASITPEMLVVMQMSPADQATRSSRRSSSRGQPDVRGPHAHRQRLRAGLGHEQGDRRADGPKGLGDAAAVQQTDGRAGAKPKRPEGAGFPKEFYKSHAQSLRKQGKCPWCGGACQGKFCDKKSSEMLCGFCSKKGHLKEVCATQAWEKSGKTVQQAKAVQGDDAEEEDEGAAVSVVTLNTVAAFAPTPRINAKIRAAGRASASRACPTPAPPGRSSPANVAEEHGLRPAADQGQDPRRKRQQHGLRRNGEHQYHL